MTEGVKPKPEKIIENICGEGFVKRYLGYKDKYPSLFEGVITSRFNLCDYMAILFFDKEPDIITEYKERWYKGGLSSDGTQDWYIVSEELYLKTKGIKDFWTKEFCLKTKGAKE